MNYIYVSKYIIYFIVIINSILTDTELVYSNFIVMFLLFVLNSQFKSLIKEEKIVFVILVVDFGYILIIDKIYYLAVLFFILIIMLDGYNLTSRKKMNYYFCMTILFVCYVIKDRNFLIISLVLLNSIFVLLFLNCFKIINQKFKETNKSYDKNRIYSHELEFSKQKLEDYIHIVEYSSQLEERNRLAREIHDSIGHKMASVLMQMEAAMKLNVINKSNGERMLLEVKENLRATIDILRRTVKGIQPNNFTDYLELTKDMVDKFVKDTGIKIDMNIIGDYIDINTTIKLAIYKNIQESITNSVRHGRANYIKISIICNLDEIVLSVKDNGKGCLNFSKGMGIMGIEERVKILRGKNIFIHKTGFELKSYIPRIKTL